MMAERAVHHQDWDLLLPQIMRTIRAVPHSTTGETANYMMMGREVRLPDDLYHQATRAESQTTDSYAAELQERLAQAHELVRSKQLTVRVEGTEEPNLFKEGDWVWLKSKQKAKGMANARKLQPKFIGPFKIVESLPYHTYRVSRDGKTTIEHEGRIKLHVTASQQGQPMPIQPPPPPPKPVRAPRAPALPAPEPPTGISYYAPAPHSALYDYDSHQIEIESLPNLTPRREEQPELPEPYAPLAITEGECAEPPATSDNTEQGVEQPEIPLADHAAFPPLEDHVPRRPGRKHQLPPRFQDYIMD
jgi:hypothetical protein